MLFCSSFVGLESFVKVNITVKDINDNKPELAVDEIFLCENDFAGTVIKMVFTAASRHFDLLVFN